MEKHTYSFALSSKYSKSSQITSPIRHNLYKQGARRFRLVVKKNQRRIMPTDQYKYRSTNVANYSPFQSI